MKREWGESSEGLEEETTSVVIWWTSIVDCRSRRHAARLEVQLFVVCLSP
jgi:hypothetical protein